MRTKILAMALIGGLFLALPFMVQASSDQGHGTTEHGAGHGESHGGVHGEASSGHGDSHGGGHGGAHGGGHEKPVDVSSTQNVIGTLALLFIVAVLTHVSFQNHLEKKRNPGGHGHH